MKTQGPSKPLTYVPLDDYQKYHYITDIDIASMLVCKKFTLADIVPVNHIKASFVFLAHPSIAEMVDNFWTNKTEVHPLEFATARKNLKSRIYGMQKSY